MLLYEHAHEAAEASFVRAMDIASKQRANALELRAAISLADLWRDHGKRSEAHDVLAPIFDRFTEGFDTPDLIQAKSLLTKLS